MTNYIGENETNINNGFSRLMVDLHKALNAKEAPSQAEKDALINTMGEYGMILAESLFRLRQLETSLHGFARAASYNQKRIEELKVF